jgi:hypothetical protein
MLWAWEQAMDFSFLAGRPDTGVAYLAATVTLAKTNVSVRFRGVPVVIPPKTPCMPVLRIEGTEMPVEIAPWLRAAARVIARNPTPALQLDFDAKPAQYAYYFKLLEALRRDHGKGLFLSMTVLAGACTALTPWFVNAPADEFVPMLFRMGEGGRSVVNLLERRGAFAHPACQSALGYSMDESLAPRLTSARSYWFSPVPWTKELWSAVSSPPSAPLRR